MRFIPETANRKDWPRLVSQAFKSLLERVGAVEAATAGNKDGWGFVTDGTAGQVLVADTAVQVTIDGLGAGNTAELPVGISAIWDTATNTISGTNGDSRDVEFLFNFVPSDGTASKLELWIDIGGGFPDLFPETKDILSGSGVDHRRFYNFLCFNRATWEANGGKIMVRADGPGTLKAKQILVGIEHRA